MRGLTALLAVLVLAGCSSAAPTPPPPTPIPSADVSTPAAGTLGGHLASLSTQFQSDASILKGEVAAGDRQSTETDAAFFVTDATTELSWLADNPQSCPAYAKWKSLLTQATMLFGTAAAGKTIKTSQLDALSKAFDAFFAGGGASGC